MKTWIKLNLKAWIWIKFESLGYFHPRTHIHINTSHSKIIVRHLKMNNKYINNNFQFTIFPICFLGVLPLLRSLEQTVPGWTLSTMKWQCMFMKRWLMERSWQKSLTRHMKMLNTCLVTSCLLMSWVSLLNYIDSQYVNLM